MSASLLLLPFLLLQTATAPVFNSSRAWEDLRQLVSFGPRPAGSAAIERSRQYIKDELAKAGLTVTEQAWDDQTPLGRVHMVNLRATLPGTSKNRLIIAGHYDTKLFRDFPFVGANDGGSSAAFLLEMARALKGRRAPLTIELVFLDGEEAVVDWTGIDHTYGSRHYVLAARADGSIDSIRGFILVDMIGDRDLRIRPDGNSTAWMTNAIWDAARRHNLAEYFVSEPTMIDDDHLPFVAAGIPSVDIIDLDYPAWHTRRDTLDAVSARSLQVVGDVLLAALPTIENRLAR
jgi:glutaminyl-peptide cyclotransferase